MKRILLGSGLVLALLSAHAAPDPSAAPLEDLPVFSKTKRISVRGLAGGRNLEMAEWAEEVVEKVEDAMGFRMPLTSTYPIIITFIDSPDEPRFKVVRQQRPFESGILQKLIVLNYREAEREDVLEGLVSLMLNRYAISKQPKADRSKRLAQVPDWMSVGLAQHLYATIRERNRTLVGEQWAAGKAPDMESLLNLDRLPPGRWPNKSACGLAVGWLVSLEEWRSIVPPLFGLWSKGTRVDKPWLAEQVNAAISPVDIEKHWDLWIARTGKTVTGGVKPEDQLARLKQMLVIEPRTLGIPYPQQARQQLGWEDLPDLRKEAWFEPLRLKLHYQVKFLDRGDTNFSAVLNGFDTYLEALGKGKRRLLGGAPSKPELLGILSEALGGLKNYEAFLRSRMNYLDRFDGP